MSKSIKCLPNKIHKMDRFLEICLLIILSKESGYGYILLGHLEEYGFSQEELNVGSLYRVLRGMEKNGLVSSVWETSSQGPDKRVYEITEVGKSELSWWMEVLAERREKIKFVLEKYNYLKESKLL